MLNSSSGIVRDRAEALAPTADATIASALADRAR
jgi:hypothetical protein